MALLLFNHYNTHTQIYTYNYNGCFYVLQKKVATKQDIVTLVQLLKYINQYLLFSGKVPVFQ